MWEISFADPNVEHVGERNVRKQWERREREAAAREGREDPTRVIQSYKSYKAQRDAQRKLEDKRNSQVSSSTGGSVRSSESRFGFLSKRGRNKSMSEAASNAGDSVVEPKSPTGASDPGPVGLSELVKILEAGAGGGGDANAENTPLLQTTSEQSSIAASRESATPSFATASTLASDSPRDSRNSRSMTDPHNVGDGKLIQSEHHLQELGKSSFVARDKETIVSPRSPDDGRSDVTSEVRISSDGDKVVRAPLKARKLGVPQFFDDTDDSLMLSFQELDFKKKVAADDQRGKNGHLPAVVPSTKARNDAAKQKPSRVTDILTAMLPPPRPQRSQVPPRINPPPVENLPPTQGPPPMMPPPSPFMRDVHTNSMYADSEVAPPIPPKARGRGRKEVPGPADPTPPGQGVKVREPAYWLHSNLTSLRRDIVMMATAAPEIMLANLKAKLPILGDSRMYQEWEAIQKRWMFSFLNQEEGYAKDLQQISYSLDTKPHILALYDDTSSATFVAAALQEGVKLTHVASVPMDRTFFPNVTAVDAPTVKARLGYVEFKLNQKIKERIAAVTCLRMGSVLEERDISVFLTEIHYTLAGGGFLYVTLMDACPSEESSFGPLLRKWMKDHLLLELEKHGRSTVPSRSIPAKMRIAGLLGPGSRFTECRAPVALEGYGGADEIAGHGGPVLAEARCIAMHMLWQEIWGKLVVGARSWWWEDEDILKECIEYKTHFSYFFVKGVKRPDVVKN